METMAVHTALLFSSLAHAERSRDTLKVTQQSLLVGVARLGVFKSVSKVG
jgi:hypothetical protein